MMFVAPAWTADWLNAWLAAIGATLLVPDLRLGWTDDPRPAACFEGVDDVVGALAAAFPTEDDLTSLSTARVLPGRHELPHEASVEAYSDRAEWARERCDWTLAALLTDLAPDSRGAVRRSPLNTPAPRGRTVTDRVLSVRRAIDCELPQAVAASVVGVLRVRGNGLGFDVRRLSAKTDPVGDNWADPVVEVLAFVGLHFLPARGNGRTLTIRLQGTDGVLRWPAWRSRLNAAAIDALLDRSSLATGDVTEVYEGRKLRASSSSDPTRAFGSVRAASQP
jgi:hypothetical protein